MGRKKNKTKTNKTKLVYDIERYPIHNNFYFENTSMLISITTRDFNINQYFKSFKSAGAKHDEIMEEASEIDETQIEIEEEEEEENTLDENAGEAIVTDAESRINPSIKKFYKNRYLLFSLFDRGIKLDEESWFSVAPEVIAKHMAQRLKCRLALDAFCGSGGSLIQLAKNCETVIANDIDPVKIENARTNTQIYEVHQKICFSCQNFLCYQNEESSPKGNIDLVFLAPPWGGTSYNNSLKFDIFTQIQPCVRKILKKAFELSRNVVMLMPKNLIIGDVVQLFYQIFADMKEDVRSKQKRWCLEFEKLLFSGKLKQIAIYFGEKSQINRSIELESLFNKFDLNPKEKALFKESIEKNGLFDTILAAARQHMEGDRSGGDSGKNQTEDEMLD